MEYDIDNILNKPQLCRFVEESRIIEMRDNENSDWGYEISVDQCKDVNTLLQDLQQVTDKSWCNLEHVRQLVNLLRTHIN